MAVATPLEGPTRCAPGELQQPREQRGALDAGAEARVDVDVERRHALEAAGDVLALPPELERERPPGLGVVREHAQGDGPALDVLEPRAGHDEHRDAELADEGGIALVVLRRDAGPDHHEVGVRGLDARHGHIGRSDGGAHAQAREQALRATGHDEHEPRRRLDRDDAVRAVPGARGIGRVELARGRLGLGAAGRRDERAERERDETGGESGAAAHGRSVGAALQGALRTIGVEACEAP